MISEFARTNWSPPRVIALARGDVTGDRISDTVYLTGIKTPDSPTVQQITLHIQDGKSGRVTCILLQENAGYNPTIFLGDFIGDGVDDIFIIINTLAWWEGRFVLQNQFVAIHGSSNPS